MCRDGNEASTEAVFWVWLALERGVARAEEGHVIAPGSCIKLSQKLIRGSGLALV